MLFTHLYSALIFIFCCDVFSFFSVTHATHKIKVVFFHLSVYPLRGICFSLKVDFLCVIEDANRFLNNSLSI